MLKFRMNWDMMNEVFGEEKANLILKAIYAAKDLEDLYDGSYDSIRFSIGEPDYNQSSYIPFDVPCDEYSIIAVAENEYNPVYVPEDGIYDSDLNWDHLLTFYIKRREVIA